MECVFCEIIAGTKKGSIVYRDDLCTAFLTNGPLNAGHTLVIPNEHASYLSELPPDTAAHMFRVGQMIATALRKSEIQCEGVTLVLNDGEAANQTVFHSHLHINPRNVDDGFALKLSDSESSGSSREELNEVAGMLRDNINSIT